MNDARRRRIELQKRIKYQREHFKPIDDSEPTAHQIAEYEAEVRKFDLPCEHGIKKPYAFCCQCYPNFVAFRLSKEWDVLDYPIPVRVYLNDEIGTRWFINLDLSRKHPTEELRNMQINGFWHNRDGRPTYIPPNRIVEAHLIDYDEETVIIPDSDEFERGKI